MLMSSRVAGDRLPSHSAPAVARIHRSAYPRHAHAYRSTANVTGGAQALSSAV